MNADSLKIAQRAAGANISVDVAAGDALLELPSKHYSFWAWTDTVTNVPMNAASFTNPRYDSVVAWVDTSVVTTTTPNSPGSFKFKVIAGTAAGSPVAVSDATIQSALGASIAWIRLADVLRPTGVDNVTNANIVDRRSALTSKTPLAPASVKATNVDWTSTGGIWWQEIGRATANGAVTSLSVDISSNRKRHYQIIANGVSSAASDSYFLLRINGLSSGYRKIGYGVANGGSGVMPFDASETDSLNTMTVTGNGGLFNIEQTLLDTGSGYVRGMCQSGHLGYMSNSLSTWKRSGSSPLMNTIDLVSTVANGVGVGSELIVLGRD
ncbi:hypothetical protein [Gordonia sp. CNJ-863]|uniref:hypothetical protein n=1 Tax=Gordonia sp. CNJ-863 TaxID=1904963 RepID=UPI00111540C0|nr:hypothetical protein [Gordonia sp. CNJ-863]